MAPLMRAFLVRLSRLVFGLALYAVGIVITLNAKIGFAPWDVFHVGLASVSGLSIGVASIVTGLAIAALAASLGEKLGLGTILNMLLIGIFLDVIIALRLIPVAASLPAGLGMMVAGLFIIALASYFYIGSGFGAGPRDSLMVALTRISRLPVGLVRGAIELAAVLTGWLLGGMVGPGTILAALAMGVCVQVTFRLLRFDPAAVVHQSLGASLAPFLGGGGPKP